MRASALRASAVACACAALVSGCSAVQGLAPTLELTTATIPTTSPRCGLTRAEKSSRGSMVRKLVTVSVGTPR